MTLRKEPIQKRAMEKVELILKHSADLFSKKGYDTTTTRDIAQNADLPVGTIYQFFLDKKSILLKLAEDYGQKLDEFYSELSKIETKNLNSEEFVGSILNSFIDFDKENPEYFLIFNFSYFNQELRDSIEELNKKIISYEGGLFKKHNPKFNPALFQFEMEFLFSSITMLFLKFKTTQDKNMKDSTMGEMKRLLGFYLEIFYK